jgi:hypothetical protein
MGVTIHRPGPTPDHPVSGDVVVTPRIYWDETKTRLLEEGHPDARFLAYAEGTVVPRALAEQAGLVAFLEPAPVEPAPVSTRRTRTRGDRQVAPGVVADTSVDGVAHTLAAEPAKTIPNGVNERG